MLRPCSPADQRAAGAGASTRSNAGGRPRRPPPSPHHGATSWRSGRVTAASNRTSARSPSTSGTCARRTAAGCSSRRRAIGTCFPGSPGCSRCRCDGRSGGAATIPRRHSSPLIGARRGGRHPTGSPHGTCSCSVSWRRRPCRRRSSTRCSPRRSPSPVTTSASATARSASPARSCVPASCWCCRWLCSPTGGAGAASWWPSPWRPRW